MVGCMYNLRWIFIKHTGSCSRIAWEGDLCGGGGGSLGSVCTNMLYNFYRDNGCPFCIGTVEWFKVLKPRPVSGGLAPLNIRRTY